jgi:hypothetical protein
MCWFPPTGQNVSDEEKRLTTPTLELHDIQRLRRDLHLRIRGHEERGMLGMQSKVQEHRTGKVSHLSPSTLAKSDVFDNTLQNKS